MADTILISTPPCYSAVLRNSTALFFLVLGTLAYKTAQSLRLNTSIQSPLSIRITDIIIDIWLYTPALASRFLSAQKCEIKNPPTAQRHQPPKMTDQRLPIQTQHCRFCNHLLLATTRNISTLPRRSGEGKDKALILPLERKNSTDGEVEADLEEEAKATETPSRKTRHTSSHTTLLLATTIPDRRATVIRREDGIEKRILLRCGRCKVVVGYYLDRVHWASTGDRGVGVRDGEQEERPPAVYLLPGAVVETEKLGGEGVGEREWREWAI